MKRRKFIKTATLSSAALTLGSSNASAVSQKNKPVIIDGMGEIRIEYSMSLIREVIESGMTAVQVTLGNPALHGPEAFQDVLNEIAAYEKHINTNRDYFIKATRIADLYQAQKQKKLAIMYLFQNTTPIGDNLDNINFFYDLGVRCIQLTYNTQNLVGAGCSERTNGGISKFGIQVIERLNDLGILVDLSHANMPTTADAIKFSKKPPLITHSCCSTVYDHYRGVSDENIRALGDKGGVMGVCQLNPFLSSKERSTLDDYFKHIDHVVKIAGIEAVGIGSDREHQTIPDTEEEKRKLEKEMARLGSAKVIWPFFVSELNHPRRMETIWDGLKKRGYKSTEIEKIVGGNFLRVFKEVIG
jgi:membrane dipeptidase